MNNINSSEKQQLLRLRNNEIFINCFKKLVLDKKLDSYESYYLLSSSIIFLRYYNSDKRFRGYFNIAYYIILKYSLLHKDYKPLYDISLQIGFYPISNFILEKKILNESFLNEAIVNNKIRKNYFKENYIETVEQHNCVNGILKNLVNKDIAYIAPTSFGKSSLIKEIIRLNNYYKIVIVVPTKSLILQTYNDVKKSNLNYRLILHDEMFNYEDRFIGILTQERATRLISKYNVALDLLIIDEAHNLLSNDSRNILLSRLIMLNYNRNNNQRLLFLSPLVSNASNLKVKNTSDHEIFDYSISHNMKIFEPFFLDKEGKVYKYNRYTDEYYYLKDKLSFFDYIIENSKEKNFIYSYRPKHVEAIAEGINDKLNTVETIQVLKNIADVISSEISSEIDIVKYITKGIVYIHGQLPNILKEFLEYKYREVPELKYIIANSVILEGINFPIDNLYITNTYKLNSKELHNLIGRVNRLNYVFENSLDKLVSSVHFVDSEEFTNRRSIMKNKIALLRENSLQDANHNPLLQNYRIDNLGLNRENKIKQNLKDENLIESTNFLVFSDLLNLSDKIKKYFIENAIDNFYENYEELIPQIILNINSITNSVDVVNTIYEVFIENVEVSLVDFELGRLKNVAARNYYTNYINKFQLLGLKEKIVNTICYFQEKASSSIDSFLYIGKSFGEEEEKEVRSSNVYNPNQYRNKVYINLRGKTTQQLANLSLIKIKIEEDFINFKLKKLITFLFDFNCISEDTYYSAIYGTNERELINLTRIGLTPNICRILRDQNQIHNLVFDQNGNLDCNSDFLDFMKTQSEFFNFEVNKYLK